MNTSNLNYLGPPGTLGKALTVAPFAEANRTGTSGAAPDSRRSRSCARIHKIVGGSIWLGRGAEHTEQAILCSSRPTDDR